MFRSAILFAIATLTAAATLAQPSKFVPIDPFDQVKSMGRGLNILWDDPIWRNFDSARIQARHYRIMHEGGFQNVRIGLTAFAHMDANNVLDATWLKSLDWVVKNALDNHLTAIINNHDMGICGNSPAVCKPRLTAYWQQISERYKDEPNTVMFEILNEPNGQLTPEVWNAWIKDFLAVIRKTNPRRNVIVGPTIWYNVHELDKMELPEDDRNLIVTVHYYIPMVFTHQGAWWVPETYRLSGVTWGTDEQKHVIEQDFAGVQQWSKAHKRPIYLGEFGAYEGSGSDLASRVRYTSYVARTAESLGWAWAVWQFDSSFVVYDMAKDDWVRPIWKAHVPEIKD